MWPKERVEALMSILENEELSPKDIGERIGVSKQSVTRFIGRHKIAVNYQWRAKYWDREKISELIRLIECGLTSLQISREMGIPQNTIMAYIRKSGLKKPVIFNDNHWPKERIDSIEFLIAIGIKSRKKIAEHLGISRNAVIGWLWRKGMSVNRTGHISTSMERLDAMLARSGSGCRYIAADPRDPEWKFCGKPLKSITSSWCEEHHAICWEKKRDMPKLSGNWQEGTPRHPWLERGPVMQRGNMS